MPSVLIKPEGGVITPKRKTGRPPTVDKTNPIVESKITQAIAVGREAGKTATIKSVRDIVRTPELKEILVDLLGMSNMAEPQKAFLKALFIDGMTQHEAIQEAFGRDLGYAEEPTARAIRQQKSIQEFVGIIKRIYVQLVPVAILKEVDIMLDPVADKELQLRAAQDIQDRAGIGTTGPANKLPVTVIINPPPGTPTAVAVQGENVAVQVNQDGK